MGRIAISIKGGIQRDGVGGEMMEFGGQGVELRLDILNVGVDVAMTFFELVPTLFVVEMELFDGLKAIGECLAF